MVLSWFTWTRPDGSVRVTRRPQVANPPSPFLTNNMSCPLVARQHLQKRGGFLATSGESWMTVDNIELYLRLIPGARVRVVPKVMVDCRDHSGSRASDYTRTTAGALEMSRLLEVYGGQFRSWPMDHARLQAQAALRWSGAGDLRQTAHHAVLALRAAPSARSQLDVLRTLGPTLTRDRLPSARGVPLRHR